jgi:FERM central domain
MQILYDCLISPCVNRQIVTRMLDIAENLREMSATVAKLTFIKVWQSLPDAGHAYFVVSFKGSTKKVNFCLEHRCIELVHSGVYFRCSSVYTVYIFVYMVLSYTFCNTPRTP